mmetsp:Transcript_14375/g.36745  ORF Transcript_14375/g.36745 Transcript_14375/m.36745 type:complete len:236 (-) Transcript_14375:116-823(-)
MMQTSRLSSSGYQANLSGVRSSPKFSFTGKPRTSTASLDTPGPGAYSEVSSSKASRLSQSPSHSFGTAARDYRGNVSSPGPGQYSPEETRRPSSAQYGFGSSQRNGLRGSPKASNPGPGAYHHQGRIGDEGPTYHIASRREGKKPSEVPGPGAYEVELDHTVNTLATVPSSPKFGFGTAQREALRLQMSPGPGAYTVDSDASGPKFSMPSRRDIRKSLDTPGPGQYESNTTLFGY